MVNQLPEPSEEQIQVIQAISENNLIIDSVAGSGKTTTVMHLAKHHTESKILLLTYNKRLKFETRSRVLSLGIKNTETHSYHSFCHKYYGKCHNDSMILKLLSGCTQPALGFNYQILVLDEAQDITPVYFELIYKIIHDMTDVIKPMLCLLGDRNQCIFKFNGADERFMVHGKKLFSINQYPWTETKLSTTYRLTDQCADFLNNVILKDQRLKAVKRGAKVRYIICDCFAGKLGLLDDENDSSRACEEIKYYLKSYSPEDIFILAPSVKTEKSPVRQLANILTEKNIPIFVPTNDEEQVDDDVLRGKIAFCTFHQVKGLERKVVVVYGFDETYFLFYNKQAAKNPMRCPNELYVALTRAREQMTIFHHYSNNFLPFVDAKMIKRYADFQGDEKWIEKKKTNDSLNPIKMSVTELLKHLPSQVIDNAMQYIQVSTVREGGEMINISSKTKQGDLYENVSEISGTAIPGYYEIMTQGTCTMFSVLKKHILFDQKEKEKEKVPKKSLFRQGEKKKEKDIKEMDINQINISQIQIDELLYIANMYCAHVSGYNFKINQIIDYNWLQINDLQLCVDRLRTEIPGRAKYEVKYELKQRDEFIEPRRELVGYVDCIDQHDDLYEFKCVNQIQDEHFLQVAIYQYMRETQIRDECERKIKELRNNYRNPDQDQEHDVKVGDYVQFKIEYHDVPGHGICTKVFNNGTLRVDKRYVKKENLILPSKFDQKVQELEKISNGSRNYYLFNILTNAKYQIISDYDKLCQLVHYLVKSKYYNDHQIPDDQFIAQASNGISKYNTIHDAVSDAIPDTIPDTVSKSKDGTKDQVSKSKNKYPKKVSKCPKDQL
jgi:hypothetical protein